MEEAINFKASNQHFRKYTFIGDINKSVLIGVITVFLFHNFSPITMGIIDMWKILRVESSIKILPTEPSSSNIVKCQLN